MDKKWGKTGRRGSPATSADADSNTCSNSENRRRSATSASAFFHNRRSSIRASIKKVTRGSDASKNSSKNFSTQRKPLPSTGLAFLKERLPLRINQDFSVLKFSTTYFQNFFKNLTIFFGILSIRN